LISTILFDLYDIYIKARAGTRAGTSARISATTRISAITSISATTRVNARINTLELTPASTPA
jgi:hypothetical protein